MTEKELLYFRNYRKRNTEYFKVKNKQWRANDRVIEKTDRQTLSDRYVIDVIKKNLNYRISKSDIPKELIQIKRNLIVLKRTIKNNEQKQNTSS